MGDGYSDKSVTPITYQPAAANVPQATVESVTDFANKMTLSMATIGTTIAPAVPLIFEQITPIIGEGIYIYRLIDAENILALGVTRLWKYNLVTGAVTNLGPNPSLVWPGLDMRKYGNTIHVTSGASALNRWALYRSLDNGASWETKYANSPGSSAARIYLSSDGQTVIVVIYLSTCLRLAISTDGGANYTFTSTATGPFIVSPARYSALFLGGTSWLIFCSTMTLGIYIWRSDDSGSTWSSPTIITTAYTSVSIADAIDHGAGVIVWSGIKSTDGGLNWSLVANSISTTIIPLGGNVAVSLGADFYKTTDAWATRTKFQPSVGQSYTGIVFSWVVDYIGGTLFAWSSAGSVMDTAPIFICKPLKEHFVTLPEFQVASPAKLNALITATAQMITANKQGTVKLYLQHKNDIVTAYSSLADVAGTWTDCGALTHDTPLNLPAFTARSGEWILPKIGFACTDTTGIQPAPELSSIAFAWTSDVAAPGSPSITRIVKDIDTTYGYRVDFGALPAGSRHLIVEGQKNSGGYLPFNNKAAWASGTHMKLRGSRDVVEEAGERNETSLSSRSGFVENDTVQVKVAAEDDVGNRSAFVESEVLSLIAEPPPAFIPVLVNRYSTKVRKHLKATIRN